jgi:hypothetical protein
MAFDVIAFLWSDLAVEPGKEIAFTVDGCAVRRVGAESLERLPGCGREDPDRVDKARFDDVAGRGSLDGTVVFESFVGTGGRCRAVPTSLAFVVASRFDSNDRTLALASFILLEGDKSDDGALRGDVCRRGVGWRIAVAVVVACFGFGVSSESNRMVLVSEIRSGGDVADGTLGASDDVDALPSFPVCDNVSLQYFIPFTTLTPTSRLCPDDSLMLLGSSDRSSCSMRDSLLYLTKAEVGL